MRRSPRSLVIALFVSVAVAPDVAVAEGAPAGASADAVAALTDLLVSIDAVRALTYRFVKRERLRDGTLTDSEHEVKWLAPGRVYMKTLRPRVGQEVLFDPTRDSRRLRVHIGRFPDFTLHLDIDGDLATRGEHHLVSHVGFAYIAGVLRRSAERARREPMGETAGLERRCEAGVCRDHLVLVAGRRAPARVMAEPGEPLVAFAERAGADPYLVAYTNPDVLGLASRLRRREYVVPAYYGSRTEVVIDPVMRLPLAQTVWDDQGRLYEDYRFEELRRDPPLVEADFDPANRAYGF